MVIHSVKERSETLIKYVSHMEASIIPNYLGLLATDTMEKDDRHV